MSIVQRAKNIILKPSDEWNIISREPATISGILGGYAAILAAIPMAAGILFTGALGISGAGLLGGGAIPLGFEAIAAMSVIGYILSLITLDLMGIIVNSVSPSFNGKSDLHQSLKLLTYASTPTWLAGLVGWIPILGALVSFAGGRLHRGHCAHLCCPVFDCVRHHHRPSVFNIFCRRSDRRTVRRIICVYAPSKMGMPQLSRRHGANYATK